MNNVFVADDKFIMERKRVHALLEKTVKNSVVFVTAGEGYGKTYAVNSFLRRRNKTAIWLSLTERDNDPLHFWESVTKALSLRDSRTGKDLEEMGFPESPNQITRFLSILSSTLPRRKQFAIVADNFHFISEKSILDIVNGLLSSPYPKETIILISRREPSLNTMSLLSKGLLSRVTVDDLRFTQEEILAYFRLRNMNLSREDAKEIFTDTGGWVLAISLIAQEMENGDKTYNRSLIQGECIRGMMDALFASVPVFYQRFLITLSLFDQWPLEVMEKLTVCLSMDLPPMGEQDIYMNRLSALYHYDVFLHGFRIHPLFLEYLREKKRELSRQEIKTACSIYAQWCMKNRLLADAAAYYGMAGDYEGLFAAIYSSPRILSRTAASSFMEIIDRLLNDDEQNQNDKKLIFLRCVTRPGLLLNLGRYEESRASLEKSIREFESLPPGDLSSWILSACYNTLGVLGLFSYSKVRDLSGTVEYFQRGHYYWKFYPYTVLGPMSKTSIGSYANMIGHPPKEGEFERYINTLAQCIPYASCSIGGYLSGGDSLCRAELFFFKGELNAAEQYAREAVLKAREKGQYEIVSKSLFYLLRVYLCTGNISAGREIWTQIQAMLDLEDYINRYVIYDVITGWIYAHTGAAERIAPWLRNEFEESDLNLHYQNYETMVKAKSLFSEKRYAETLKFLKQKRVREGIGSFHFGMLEITVLEAAVRSRLGDTAGALKALNAAYAMAAPNSFDMPFIELGEDARALVNAALAAVNAGKPLAIKRDWLEAIRGKAAVYVKKLGTTAEQYRGRQRENDIPFLAAQELSVLTGISRGLTREEIADEQSLSVSTVKNIIKIIYDKLGAINRADAIRIATALGLLR